MRKLAKGGGALYVPPATAGQVYGDFGEQNQSPLSQKPPIQFSNNFWHLSLLSFSRLWWRRQTLKNIQDVGLRLRMTRTIDLFNTMRDTVKEVYARTHCHHLPLRHIWRIFFSIMYLKAQGTILK